jgi:hypothetical protein
VWASWGWRQAQRNLRDLPQAAIKPAGRRATSGFSFVALLFCRAANDAMN